MADHLTAVNNMKKALLSLFTVVSLNAGAVDFTVLGEIQDMTCEVKTEYKNLVINLPTVGKSAFANSTSAGFTPFQFEIARCNNLTASHLGKELYAFFESEHLDMRTHTLTNAASRNQARNVNIRLTNRDGSAIKVSNATAAADTTFNPVENYRGGERIDLNRQSYVLHYGAEYFATGVVSAGIVESFATFTIRYK